MQRSINERGLDKAHSGGAGSATMGQAEYSGNGGVERSDLLAFLLDFAGGHGEHRTPDTYSAL